MDYTTIVNTFASFYNDDEDVESANVILIDSKIREIMGDDNSTDEFIFGIIPTELIETIGNFSNSTDSTSTTRNNENIYRDPLSIIVPITVIYAIIFIAGILGNVITCVVIATNKTMHTATNYYLFNLAVSDTFILLFGE